MSRKYPHPRGRFIHPAVILLVVISILLNILLSTIVRATALPFYIDTVGIIVATALGGTVPGIITAFVTNAVNFFMDGESIFYASLNMLIAILSAAYFGEYSSFRKKKKQMQGKTRSEDDGERNPAGLLVFTLLLALIGGGLGGAITWYLYETPSDAPMIIRMSAWLSQHIGLSVFGCHMVSTFVADFLDKALSVLVSLLIIYILPDKIKKLVKLSSWCQKPMTPDEQVRAERKVKGKFSIGLRINIILVLSTLLMTVVCLAFNVISFRENTIETLSSSAAQTAFLASKEIDPSKVDVYLQMGSSAPGYMETKARLTDIKESSSNIAFLYVYKIARDGCHVVFDLDATLSDGSFVPGDPPGMLVRFEQASISFLEELLAGERIPTVEMEDEYGSFIASYCPIYDQSGNCVCYAVSNIEYGLVRYPLDRYFGRVVLLFSGFLILIVAVSILTTRYHIVMPITSMTYYANELVDSRGGANEESYERIEELDIRTGDEIEQLYRALCNLTGDTVHQLNDNKNKTEAISKMQSVLLMTMADMVESRDSDTGAHVLKTAAYVRIILQGLKKNGYYAEKISDKYIRDVEMSAPLHDVGKINIPDAILNKPGKLSPEEYEIMKSHTTSGKRILENAISSMEGDNYLKEARNMAAYHHERWDGKGYPEGLHGEVIPLSARVMAVADVFDALSSSRVYKSALPFDEAVRIISEGSGTQFDPLCVEVFVESAAEVKKVLNKYQEI
ncbi:MAG: HD domain-containing protein [Lachnospiraceae bacterium]|nr:HD domain-containing protein [Lachnospiraceae bacterium]